MCKDLYALFQMSGQNRNFYGNKGKNRKILKNWNIYGKIGRLPLLTGQKVGKVGKAFPCATYSLFLTFSHLQLTITLTEGKTLG